MNRKILALIGILVVSGFIAAGVAIWILKPRHEPMLHYQDALKLVEQGNYEAAKLKLEIATAQGGGRIAEIMALRADVELKLPDPRIDAVVTWYRQAKDLEGDNIEYRRKLALAYERGRRWDQMLTEAEELSRLAPEDVEAIEIAVRASRVLHYQATGSEARREYLSRALLAQSRLVELEGDKLEHYRVMYQLHLQQEPVAIDEAEEVLKTALERVTNKTHVHLELHDFYRYRMNWAEQNAPGERDRYRLLAESSLREAERLVEAGDGADAMALIKLALTYAQEGDSVKAASYADRAIAADSRDANPYIVRAELYRRDQNPEAAIGILRRGLEAVAVEEPTDADRETKAGLLAEVVSLLLATNPTSAEIGENLSELENLRAPRATLNLLKGRQALSQNRYDDARGLLEEGVRSPQGPRQMAQTMYFLGEAYERLGQTGRAEQAYRDALVNNSQMEVALRRLARLQSTELGKYREGEIGARRLIAAYPEDRSLRLILASALQGQGNLAGAGAEYAKAISLDATLFDAYVMLANIQSAQNQSAAAEQTLKQGLEKVQDAQRFVLYLALVEHYQKSQDAAKAAQIVSRAQSDAALTDQQKTHLRINQSASVDDRLKLAEEELQKSPDDAQRMALVAALLAQNNRQEESVALMRRVFERAVETQQVELAERAWHGVWQSVLESADLSVAKAWLEKAPATFSESRQALNRAQLELVHAFRPQQQAGQSAADVRAVQVGHVDETIRLLEAIIEKDASNVDALGALGRAKFLRGGLVVAERQAMLLKAKEHYEQVLELRPQNVDARRGLSDVALNLGQPERALAELDEILKVRRGDVAALERKAMIQQSMALYEAALATRRTLEQVAAGSWPNQMAIAQLATILGLSEQVEGALVKAYGLAPAQPEVVLPYAQVLFGKGDEASRSRADKIISDLVSEHGGLASGLVRCRYLAQTGRVDLAISEAQRLAAAHPSTFDPVLFLSVLYTNSRRVGDAISLVSDFVSRNGDNYEAKMHLAEVLAISQGDMDRAEALAREVLGSAPDNVRARTMLARVLMQRAAASGDNASAVRQLDEAQREMEQVLISAPDYGMGQVTLAEIWLTRGQRSSDAAVKIDARGKAIGHLRRVPQTDAVYVQAMRQQADLLASENRAEAVAVLMTLLRVQPADLVGRLRLASLLPDNQAVSTLREGLRHNPNNAGLMIALIQRSLQMRDVRSALAPAEELVKQHGDLPDAWHVYAEVMRAADRADEATKALREQARLKPENIGFLMVLSHHLAATGELAEAGKINQELLKEHPKVARLYVMQTDLLMAEGRGADELPSAASLASARDLLIHGVGQTGAAPEILERLVFVYQMLGEWESAVRVSSQYLERNANNSQMLLRQGESLIRLKRYDEALASLRLALAIDSGHVPAMNNIAWILATEKDDLRGARQEIARALAIDPNNASYLDTSGWIHYLQGDFRRAIEELRSSLNARESALTHYHMGRAQQLRFERSGRDEDRDDAREQAVAHLERYIEMAPDGEHVQAARESLEKLRR